MDLIFIALITVLSVTSFALVVLFERLRRGRNGR